MKKVLVLCQRKSGYDYKKRRAENTIVPQIREQVVSLIGDDYEIEYFSSFTENETRGAVDIEGILQPDEYLILKNNDKIAVNDFITQNESSYALIFLNTCPFAVMDYKLISQLLAADGLMVFAAYNFSGQNSDIRHRKEVPTKFFTFVREENDVLIFTKNKSPRKKSSSPVRRSPSVVTPPITYKKGGRRRTKKVTKKRRTFKKSTAKSNFSKKCRKTTL
jgi:hypothetical protein